MVDFVGFSPSTQIQVPLAGPEVWPFVVLPPIGRANAKPASATMNRVAQRLDPRILMVRPLVGNDRGDRDIVDIARDHMACILSRMARELISADHRQPVK